MRPGPAWRSHPPVTSVIVTLARGSYREEENNSRPYSYYLRFLVLGPCRSQKLESAEERGEKEGEGGEGKEGGGVKVIMQSKTLVCYSLSIQENHSTYKEGGKGNEEQSSCSAPCTTTNNDIDNDDNNSDKANNRYITAHCYYY